MKIGTVVLLSLTAAMAKEIGGNAANAVTQVEENGQMVDKMREPVKAPAIVVAVWGEGDTPCVNLKVHGDGPGEAWATSALFGEHEAQYTLL